MIARYDPLNPVVASLLPSEGLLVVVGDIGSGKSCFAYAIAEHFRNRGRDIYTFRFPRPELLPSWIKNIEDPELPEGGVVVLDEAYISYHARSSMRRESKFIDQFTGLLRQKGILAIFVSQTTRKLDRGIINSAQGFFIKKLSRMNVRLDRSELRPILHDAWKAFKRLKMDHRKCVYSLIDDFEGMIVDANNMPSFWNDEISKAWKNVGVKDTLQRKSEKNAPTNIAVVKIYQFKKRTYKILENGDIIEET